MAAEKITYAAKNTGDLWTSTNANEIKQVVNSHADMLDAHTSSINSMSTALDETLAQHAQNTQRLNNLVQNDVPQVFLTQAEYDALMAEGTIDNDTLYNIYE